MKQEPVISVSAWWIHVLKINVDLFGVICVFVVNLLVFAAFVV